MAAAMICIGAAILIWERLESQYVWPLVIMEMTSGCCHQARKPRRTPAATAEPITPATFGPMACISR